MIASILCNVKSKILKTNVLSLALLIFTVISLHVRAQTPKYQVGTGEYNCFILNTITHQVYTTLTGVPSVIPGMPSNIVSVIGGAHHWLFIDNSGNVWVYGDNQTGECGLGNTSTSSNPVTTPTQIATDSLGKPFTNVVQALGGFTPGVGWNSSALKSDGTVWIWGSTVGGLRGNGQQGQNNTRPVQINFPAGVFITKIQISTIGIALDSAGNVWTWGGATMNVGAYALGQGTSAPDYTTPHKISLPSRAVDIAGGCYWNYALLTSGSLYGWSYFNPYLGIGTSGFMGNSNQTASPQLLDGQLNFHSASGAAIHPKAVFVNNVASYVLLTDSTIWAWGDNACGGMGNGIELNFAKYGCCPVPYGTATPEPYAWDQGFGELLQQKPVQVAPGIHNFTNVFVANSVVYYAYAEDAAGNLYAWGRNKYGVIANGVTNADPVNGNIGSIYPHSWDVPYVTKLDPFDIKAQIQSSSPYCVANPNGYPCNLYSIPFTAPPVVSAGPIQNISTSSTTLLGTAQGQGGSSVVYTIWTQLSGPDSSDLIILPSGIQPVVTGLHKGTYVFQLTVTDNNWRSNTSNVIVNVNGAPGDTAVSVVKGAPVANAGKDITIDLPSNSVILNGSGSTDTSGTIVVWQWSVLSGSPAQYSLTGSGNEEASLSDLEAGTYLVQLVVTDNNGNTGTDTTSIAVKAGSPLPAAIISSLDTVISVSDSSYVLNGTDSYAPSGDSLTSYLWQQVAGPSQAVFQTPNAAMTALSNFSIGSYLFELTVTDNAGTQASSDIVVAVDAVSGKPEQGGDSVKLYPNPVQSNLSVWLGQNIGGNIELTIFDEMGRALLRETVEKALQASEVESLNVATFMCGVYFLQVFASGFKAIIPFIKAQ